MTKGRRLATSFGYLKILTFKDLLGEVSLERSDSDLACFQQRMGSFEQRKIVRRCLSLFEKISERENLLLAQLTPQLAVVRLFKGDVLEMLEREVEDLAIKGSSPTRLVRLAPRTWLIADPSDFTIFQKGAKEGIANGKTDRSTLVNILRFTETKAVLVYSSTNPNGNLALSEDEILDLIRKGV